MDSNNWRSAQSDQPPPMDGVDWRTQLQSESRQRIVNKIMETLKRHLSLSGQDGFQELKNIAVRFEEKIYSAATSQSDYLRKISVKMLTMESKSPNTLPNALPSSSGGDGGSGSRNSQDLVPAQNMQSQVPNQGQSIPLPMAPNQPQARQQFLSQNIQNNLSSSGMQTSASLPNSVPSVSGLTQNSMSNVAQNQNLQNIPGMSQNSMGSTINQGVASNMFTNAQRQMQGRQHMQQIASRQQPQQSQTPQQYIYSQQLQNQMMKQKLQSGNIQQSLVQTPIHQNLLQATQMKTSQKPMMQTSSVLQPSMISGMQQNQQTFQQPSQSGLPHQQSVLRQQQQTSVIQQPQTQISQQQMGQQPNSVNMQQNQMIGQQDVQQQQQQRLLGQQIGLPNNHSNLQQHLMGQQGNLSNMRQQQLSHQTSSGGLPLIGSQSGNSTMQTNQHSVHVMQQSKVPVQQQSQSGASLLPSSGQQAQSESQSQSQSLSQQQLMLQLQTQSPQVRQQLGLQQQPNSLQQNLQQRIQNSNPLLQQQSMIDQQKQLFQSQRAPQEAPSTSLDSTGQTCGASAGDWQEEVYQRIKGLKDSYFTELSEMYQKVSMKLQQHESLPQQPKSEQFERLKMYKNLLEKIITFVQVPKNNIMPGHRDKLPAFENQIMGLLHSQNRPRKLGPSMQQAPMLSQMHSMSQPQQNQSQDTQAQKLEIGANPLLQSINMRGSAASIPQSNVPNLQHGSVSSLSAIGSSQQHIGNTLQASSNVDGISTPLQGNMASLQSQSGVNLLQHVNLQSGSNMLLNQHLKQQQDQMTQAQPLKHLQNRQLQQQILQKQLQQQQQQQQSQFHQQTKHQQATQIQSHQLPQLNQMNDINELKMRQGFGVRSDGFPQHQQLRPGSSFPISSPQLLKANSPQINQNSSPQIDQQNVAPSVSKTGTPLQSANSPFMPSPSAPLAPSPVPGESEKPSVSSLSNTGNVGHQQTNGPPAAPQSLSIGTPGISASPFLEYPGADGSHGNGTTVVSRKSSVTEQPLDRLLKAVKSISPKALNASVSDIGSVVSMIDRIAGSAPGNGSRTTVGEDLVAMTKCRLQTRSYLTQDGNIGAKRTRQYMSAMPLNAASSFGSMSDSLEQLTGREMSELDSTATSSIKKAKVEINHALVEEIKEINEHLIDTVVDISDEDVEPSVAIAAAIGSEGTIINCRFNGVSLCPSLKSQYASAKMSPIQPLRLLVPTNYPNCSPVLLDKLPPEVSKEYEDLSVKAKSRFSICLRGPSQPMSLKEIARTWDDCARAVISEYAQQTGGGTFSSKYGTWENCLSAT